MEIANILVFRILVIGDDKVGKSQIVKYLVDQTYSGTFIATFGVDFKFHTMKIDKQEIKLQIWTISGENRFRTTVDPYYKNAHGIVIVYDCSSLKSFQHVNNWHDVVDKNSNQNVVKMVLGNNCDLTEQRKVNKDIAREFSDQKNLIFFETSTLTGQNVVQSFQRLSQEILLQHNNHLFDMDVQINEKSTKQNKSKCY